ncbi:dTMP kinase [Kocuria varians]|uniref:dTMP kinase n=1 Tax=Kocuria varians TaxID=1272 RepID=UPI0008394D26|nr:dTMP kinase [Kocuria varians]
MKQTTRGALIVFEGGDGAGKSTQVQALARALRAAGRTVTCTREPGGTPLAEAVRALVLDPCHTPVSAQTEALLFASARADHVTRLIRPALQRGEVVVSDRFVDSSAAYQGTGRGLGVDSVLALNEWALQGLVPDLTVVLDVDQDTAESRRARRGLPEDRMESEAGAFHRAVNATFRELAARSPERYLVLDAALPAEQITRTVAERALALTAPAASSSSPASASSPGARPGLSHAAPSESHGAPSEDVTR